MKKVVFCLLAITSIMCGCQGKTESKGKVATETELNQKSDIDAVTARVMDIYQTVFKEYNHEDSLRNLDLLEGQGAYAHPADFSKNYCSREWNQLLRQIDEIDSLYHSGEMGFWDADYWIMGQDWHNLSISDLEVLSTTPNEAAVQFQLHNFDTVKPVALKLVNEDGVWKIDNFTDVNNDLDWKQSMQQYVTEETTKAKK